MEYKQYKKSIESKRKLIAKHSLELSEMLKQCPHEEVGEKSYYFSGSYNDLAYTDRWMQCILCGAKSEVTTQTHNWYG